MDEIFRSRTEITIETLSVTTIKNRAAAQPTAYCRNCCREVRWISCDHAAILVSSNGQAIHDLAVAGRLHSALKWICASSLAEHFNTEIRFAGE